MGEFELIRRHFQRDDAPAAARAAAARAGVVLGVGDDCALLEQATAPAAPPPLQPLLAVSTDMLIEGRHFFADVDPASLGHKALAVNLSDLAAMGATPRAFTLALSLPTADDAWLSAFARGLFSLADAHGASLVGGDTTRGPLAICITVMGEVPAAQALRRDRARPGDEIWVSGALGAAALAVRRRLAGTPLPPGHPALDRLERPQPRVALGRSLLGSAHAAIDLSDGLAGDLGHVLERSGSGADLDVDSVPAHECLAGLDPLERASCVLAGGDDYELAFTAPPAARAAVEAAGRACGVPVARIGRITEAPGLRLRSSVPLPSLAPYDHFR